MHAKNNRASRLVAMHDYTTSNYLFIAPVPRLPGSLQTILQHQANTDPASALHHQP